MKNLFKVLFLITIFTLFYINAFALNIVEFNPQYYPSPTRGIPISSGSIYVGIPDLDPETVGNQKTLSVRQEDGSVVQVVQPISTNAGGVPEYLGSPVTLLVEGNYSLKILDSSGSQIYYMSSNVDVESIQISFDKAYACDLPTALAALGSVNQAQLNGDCDCIIASGTTETITDNITLNMVGGTFDGVSGGGTEMLNINGPLQSGDYQWAKENLVVGGSPIIDFSRAEWFGIDGVEDEISINKALILGPTKLLAKTYICNDEVTIPAGSKFLAQGKEITKLNFNGASGSFSNGALVYAAGDGLVAIPDLASDVDKNEFELEFDSAPDISVGDVLVIYNPTDYSFSGWRAEYRAGEYVRVESVSGTTVGLQGSLYADYAAADVEMYRLDGITTSVKDMSIIGVGSGPTLRKAVRIRYCIDCKIENVKTTNFSHIGINIVQSYNTSVIDSDGFTNVANTAMQVFGLSVGNSQKVTVRGGTYSTYWSGVTTGGSNIVGSVSNRDILFTGSLIASPDGVQAFNSHGNQEHVTIDNCTLDGGYLFGGNHTKLVNSTVRGPQSNAGSARGTELSGLDHEISNNTIESDFNDSFGNIIDIGAGGTTLSDSTFSGGTFIVHNNKLIWNITSDTTLSPIILNNFGYVGSESINVKISDNEIIIPTADIRTGPAQVKISSGNNWGTVRFINNDFIGGLITTNITDGILRGNELKNGNASLGIQAIGTNNIAIEDNDIENMDLAPLYIAGPAASELKVGSVLNNRTKNNNLIDSSTVNNSFVYSNHVDELYIFGNSGVPTGPYQDRVFNINDCLKVSFDNNWTQGGGTKYSFSSVIASNRLSTAPTGGTWYAEDLIQDSSPSAGSFIGWTTITTGTAGTLAGVTGGITNGTDQLTVNDASDLRVGQFLLIAGVTGAKQIKEIDGLVITISSNADATVAGAAVTFSAAVFKTYGAITA